MKLATLIGAQELAAQGNDLLIVDCRFDLADSARGARDYAQAHVPGAVYADLNRDLSDLSKPGLGRHPLPDAAAFCALLGRWGWTPQTRVVAYDDANGALAAARLWWMLGLVGAREIAVLDGGLAAWKAAGLPLNAQAATREQTVVAVEFDASEIVYTGQLHRLREDPATLIVDARAAPRFRGENETIDPVGGHIPGARNRPFSENLQADGRFKSALVLRAEIDALLGAHTPDTVIHHCGSGVTACHNLLAFAHAGLSGSRIYAPSWSGWIADPGNPIERG
ncbi:MAG TPA: sulfurtransferase [Rudaea sp.]|jgi:thiosulfate/3-mercaptopyruvate sulfurtransferase|uniref:sulfurtransferase n=1 Tax=Rudaea sp. TaxID=2136325 RepID=UPI002F92EEDB